MHNPKPFGLSVDGEALSDHEMSIVKALVRRVGNLREISPINALRLRFGLGGGVNADVSDYGGVLRVNVKKPGVEQEFKNDPSVGIATLAIPMLYSGFIPIPHCPIGAGLTVKLTDTTLLRLRGYDDEAAQRRRGPKDSGAQTRALKKFEIDYPPQLQELGPKIPSETKTYTQYQNCFPTWFTGAMKEVVQIVGGWGKQPKDAKDESLPEGERRGMFIPEKWKVKMLAELGGNTRLPGYLGRPPETGYIQFNYKFMDTNAVSFDPSGKPWLLKVAPDGVWAMPLPMIPATTSKAFREWMEDVGDKEILNILDRFKGIPSGEGWPLDFRAWMRAGVITKVCDTSAFFEHTPYSTPLGFAFNKNGTEAYATCAEKNEGGINQGLAFMLSIRVGATKEDGKLKDQAISFESAEESAKFNEYMGSLYEQLRELNDDKAAAIKYKIRRHTPAQLKSIAGDGGPADVTYWDNLEMSPIADHSGRCYEVARGNLIGYIPNPFWPAAFLVPEPFLDMPGCISIGDQFTFPKGEDEGGNPRCDTIIYGFYDERDQLKTVKYFREDSRAGKPGEDGPTCTYSGSWEWKGETSGSAILGHFYTSDLDYRRQSDVGYTTHKVVGKHLHSSRWFVVQIYFFWTDFAAFRQEYYQIEQWSTSYDHHSLRDAVAIPWGFRSGCIYVKEEFDRIKGRSYSREWTPVRNRHRFNYWTYDAGGAWIGSPLTFPRPYPGPENYSPAYKDGRNYQGSFQQDCIPEAEEDDWEPSTDAVSDAIRNGWPDTFQGSGGMGKLLDPPKWNAIYKSENSKIENETADIYFTYDGAPVSLPTGNNHPEYFKPYPDENGNPLLLYGTALTFGDASYTYINEGNNHFGYSKYADRQRIPRFIGVINE